MKPFAHARPVKSRNRWDEFLLVTLLILTLIAGAYLRFVGINWDENQHMHPDERFLSLVEAAIVPVESLSDYFNTAVSSLNPANRGHAFFVYGTLPIFIIRYLGEALGQTDYNAITLVGRAVSAGFDLGTILLVYAIGRLLYNRWTGLLGAMFYAFAVLPIQLSHFMTVDTITNTFAYLAVFGAVWALTRRPEAVGGATDLADRSMEEKNKEEGAEPSLPIIEQFNLGKFIRDAAPYLLFGVALGAATASKINAVVLAIILPLVEGVRYSKMNQEERRIAIFPILGHLVIAGLLSFLVFRIGQPYAFKGPGFLNMSIDENWWASLQSLRAQASGNVDFPPALQWARRPITFSWENMAAWGLGLPLGIAASLAYLWMGGLILRKKDWQRHLPLWTFTGLYFVWQSFSWVRAMRYQMLIYPALALFTGWGLVQLWSARRAIKLGKIKIKPGLLRAAGIGLTGVLLFSTAIWAFAFTRIYTRPHPRVAASRWIYQNIPGALTLQMDTGNGPFQQPLPYRAGDTFDANAPYGLPFFAPADGVLQTITFPHILDQHQTGGFKQILMTVTPDADHDMVLASAQVESEFAPVDSDWRGAAYTFVFDPPVPVRADALYYLHLSLGSTETALILNGAPALGFLTSDGREFTSSLPRIQQSVRAGTPYTMNVQLVESGAITAVQIPYLVDLMGQAGVKDFTIQLQVNQQNEVTRTASLEAEFSPGEDIRGDAYTLPLAAPLQVEAGQTLTVTVTTTTENVRLVPHAPVPVHESAWDDAVPYPVDGFSPYSEGGGIYRGDLNFEMYWPDDPNKLERFETHLDQADYIFITSNRQWGTTTRVPERYLLTTHYYRNLLGCPADADLTWCYSVAEPGMFAGKLGFELAQTFQSNPNFGPLEFNTQFAEEAFTVYDHPKVLIFKKTAAYDPFEAREILRAVDLSKVVYFTPGEAANYRGPNPEQIDEPRFNLNLPADRLEAQQAGGTWAKLFDRERLLNTSQPFAVIVFYLFVSSLGLLTYPLVRLALPGLSDRGYPLSKLAGLLLLAFVVWILGSFGVPFTAKTILLVLIGMGFFSALLIIPQREVLWEELRENWRYFLTVELLALIAFVFFLTIRIGNPDLWHPYKGGEKPMDFSYLNAVLKSTTFPPYDPWFAGGYINYYYYGFVIVGVPIKLLGMVPAIAYNIILPIWYSILILSAFSVGWNLYRGIPRSKALQAVKGQSKHGLGMAFWVGLATAVGLGMLGNLGTIKLINSGFQRIAAAGTAVDGVPLGQQIRWTIEGFVQFMRGTPMPFYPGDWYWFPSRVIPGEPITEFPYFSFIYGDLHAHLIAFPITIFAISWSLSVVLDRAKWEGDGGRWAGLGRIAGFFLGALVIGALRPTNTWDFYTYLILAVIALFYSILRSYQPRLNLPMRGGDWIEKIGVAVAAALGLAGLAILFYQPFAYWFGQGYTQIEIWKGSRTPLSAYLTHWGLFLFIIISWMAWETYHWMKTTPQSALRKLAPYLNRVYAAAILTGIALVIFLSLGITVALVAVPLGVWAVVLMLRPGRSDGQIFHLFLIGTAVALTLAVELIYLPGDIGRMNTVFKFYLQAWIMFALSTGVCLGWLSQSMRYWKDRVLFFWQAVFYSLVVSALLFTVMGTTDKIRDRMAPNAPRSLDGMAFMREATYYDMGMEMQLVEDYQAIRWMQENIEGSPVIVEGQAYEYRWGNRYTIYTGLPGVVGWNWHQRQQRAILRNMVVQERVDAVNTFYITDDAAYALDFLEKYDVRFIILGQLERAFYAGSGLEKFQRYEGQFWQVVYQNEHTLIYQVLD